MKKFCFVLILLNFYVVFGQQNALIEDFNNHSNKWYSLSDKLVFNIYNGSLKVVNVGEKDSLTTAIMSPFEFNQNNDFLIESRMTLYQSEVAHGLVWNFKDNDNYYIFKVSPKTEIYTIYQYIDGVKKIILPWEEQYPFGRGSKLAHILKIEKKGSITNFFINENLVESIEINYSGTKAGIYLEPANIAKLDVDYFYIKSDKALIKKDTKAPLITITNPDLSRGFKIVKNIKKITVQGNVKDSSGIFEVLVNDQESYVDEEGNFSKEILLKLGVNSIQVKAIDLQKNTAIKEFVINRKSDVKEDVVIDKQKNLKLPLSKYFALIIGVQKYIDPTINNLDQPILDSQKLYDVLLKDYTFKDENIKFLKNPTKSDITNTLDYLSKNLTKNDNLLIFYAGHGYWDKKFKQGYWLPADADREKRGTWLSNGIIRDYLQGISTKHSLLITDACFGGGIFKTRVAFENASVAINQLYKLPSRKAMTSGALNEVPDKSVFLEYLVKRLKQNKNKYLSSEQLFASFKIAVINNSFNGQVPQFGIVKSTGDEGGDFIFIKK